MKIVYAAFLLFIFNACNSTGSNNNISDTPGNVEDSVRLTSDNIDLDRKNINPNAVKTYAETVKSFETTDEFKVRLFETKETFKYLIKISYKQIEVDDTLRLPNFGLQPTVEILKGDSIRPSCIIGFLDKSKAFKKSKLVFFKNDKLRVKVLKHYAVRQSE